MGKKIRPWQDTEYVLKLFGRTVSEARRNLQRHVLKWSTKGRCPELTGGGLVCSAGGWRAVKEAYQDGIRLAGDERIPGSSEFVEIPPKAGLKQAGEEYDRRMRIQSAGMDLSGVIAAVWRYLNVDEKEPAGPTRRPEVAKAPRSGWLYCHSGVVDLRKRGGPSTECGPFRHQQGGAKGGE